MIPLSAIVPGCLAVIALNGGPRDVAVTHEDQVAAAGSNTSTYTSRGLTLRLTATCTRVSTRCPFRAEVHGPPGLAHSVSRVEYTYVPDQRSAVRVTDAANHFRFEGAQYGGQLVHADVIARRGSSRAADTIPLQTTIPYGASVTPALPPGLRFEDKYETQYLEGTVTNLYYFRIWLRGDPSALNRVRSVDYRLPEQYFARTQIRTTRDNDYFLDGHAPKGTSWDIVAVIRWMNGRSTTHRIPFRPE